MTAFAAITTMLLKLIKCLFLLMLICFAAFSWIIFYSLTASFVPKAMGMIIASLLLLLLYSGIFYGCKKIFSF